ncbi:MAG: hypothetical protein L0H96_20985, partial [Humibacillus sp.]|nr:hypothetical protein [Humibacillus sp.]
HQAGGVMVDEVEFWKQQVLTRNRDQLTTVSKAATGWSALFAGVLGVFGTVAFSGGLTAVDRVDDPWSGVVKAATLLAVVLALAATVLAGLAAGASVSVTNDSTWDGQRDWVKRQAAGAYGRLRLAKRFGGAAGAVLLLGSTVVLLAGEAGPSVPTVVVVVDGRAVCGPLTSTATGLSVDGTGLTKVSSVTVVDACP